MSGVEGLRCIFCGRDRLRLEEANDYAWIACVDCAAEGPAMMKAEAAVNQWAEISAVVLERPVCPTCGQAFSKQGIYKHREYCRPAPPEAVR